MPFLSYIAIIKIFHGFLKKHGFKVWGWYRIIAGIALLIPIYTNVDQINTVFRVFSFR